MLYVGQANNLVWYCEPLFVTVICLVDTRSTGNDLHGVADLQSLNRIRVLCSGPTRSA